MAVTISSLAEATHKHFVALVRLGDSSYGIDPAFLDFLRELFDKLIEMFDGCQFALQRSTENSVAICNNPNRRQERRLNAKVRRGLGREDYKKYGKPMVTAVKATGRTVTVEIMDGLYIGA